MVAQHGQRYITALVSNEFLFNKTLSSSWGVSVLDNGGLIVAAQDYHQYISSPSHTLKYSCNEGASWSSFNFATSNVVIFGVITEPGESTAVVRYEL